MWYEFLMNFEHVRALVEQRLLFRVTPRLLSRET